MTFILFITIAYIITHIIAITIVFIISGIVTHINIGIKVKASIMFVHESVKTDKLL
jgi:hypothetical protein